MKPSNLRPAQHQFALEYLSNGFNATAAYQAAHPNVTYATARMEGSRTLAKPCVHAFLATQLRTRWKALHMDGDEALMRVALDARADPRRLFGPDGKMLRPSEWPDDIANSVEALEWKVDGSIKVKFASKTMARRTILEHTGKLKAPLEAGLSRLERALRADLGIVDEAE